VIIKTLDIIIPIFNEEKNIAKLYERLEATTKKIINLNTTYIFVNDGSSDKTLEILSSLSKKNLSLKIISFTRNFGHQNALACGISFSNADYIVTIDGDLQDPPELIIDMIEVCIDKYDIVYAKRKKRNGENFFKIFSAKMFYKILNCLCDLQIPEDTGDFRIITRKVAMEFNKFNEKHKFIRGLIPWLGFKSTFVLYDRDERFAGKTKYN
jgi:dolichol-phosphate mannosyltransferase